jgi:hypothetical protein
LKETFFGDACMEMDAGIKTDCQGSLYLRAKPHQLRRTYVWLTTHDRWLHPVRIDHLGVRMRIATPACVQLDGKSMVQYETMKHDESSYQLICTLSDKSGALVHTTLLYTSYNDGTRCTFAAGVDRDHRLKSVFLNGLPQVRAGLTGAQQHLDRVARLTMSLALMVTWILGAPVSKCTARSTTK